MRLLIQIGLVALGSALGGLTRWGVTVAAARLLGTWFPWGTFVINIAGSFFLGWFATILAERITTGETSWLYADDLRLMIAVGFTGSFTTFSTFEYESLRFFQEGDSWLALMYMGASLFLGLLAVRLGILLARGS